MEVNKRYFFRVESSQNDDGRMTVTQSKTKRCKTRYEGSGDEIS